jgi:hypothetical protein
LDAVAAVAERVILAFLWRPLLPDIDDDMVLETAANGRADGIVTFNRRERLCAGDAAVQHRRTVASGGAEPIGEGTMRKSNFALRLQSSLLAEARKVAEAEGVALNQLINVALAEKLSALRTESYFAERVARASIPEALRILDRAGVGQPPVKGDELPDALPKRRSPSQRRRV